MILNFVRGSACMTGWPLAVQHKSAALLSDDCPASLQSGERIHSLDDLQDIDELHVLEVRHLPLQPPSRRSQRLSLLIMPMLTQWVSS